MIAFTLSGNINVHACILYIIFEGTWSPLECTGSIPPPSSVPITMTDDHHAILYIANKISRNNRLAYLLDLEKMVLVIKLTCVFHLKVFFMSYLQNISQMCNYNTSHVLCKHNNGK